MYFQTKREFIDYEIYDALTGLSSFQRENPYYLRVIADEIFLDYLDSGYVVYSFARGWEYSNAGRRFIDCINFGTLAEMTRQKVEAEIF